MVQLPAEEVERLDAELARVARGAAAVRLAIGRGLAALAKCGGHHELGFSSLEAYALERVERGATWTRESCALAEKLEAWPRVRAAVESGRLGWSMAKVVAKAMANATAPVDEAAWLLRAERSTMREMQAAIRQGRPGSESEDATEKDADRFTTLSLTMDREDLALFECARMIVTRVSGWRALHLVMDALVDEGTSSLVVPDGARRTPFDEGLSADAQRRWATQLAHWRKEAEARCEEKVRARAAAVTAEPHEAVDFGGSVESIDARLVKLAHELATRDVTIGRLANRFFAADGWRRLGYATAAQYVRERLGSCETSIKEKRKLARRMESMPALAKAAGDGTIGYEAALLVSGIATRTTEKAWVGRATLRTLKLLREEVEAAGMLARWLDEPQAPPSEQTMKLIAEAEARVMSGEAFKEDDAEVSAHVCQVAAKQGAAGGSMPPPARGQKSAGRVTLKIRVRENTARRCEAAGGWGFGGGAAAPPPVGPRVGPAACATEGRIWQAAEPYPRARTAGSKRTTCAFEPTARAS